MWISNEENFTDGFYFMRGPNGEFVNVVRVENIDEWYVGRVWYFYKCGIDRKCYLPKALEQGYTFKKIEIPE